ncbi:CLUMA_CG020997, isoform A [Clunio marinus]|uniref:CLUMA_CG020997, isoform A n=1 Tax=Clunio marinus TaxID=568069 RepID=A0A1J1J719_9DIPT|nr:CLUMA_CG020997, isoform A [Clunio marinus]
MRLHISLLLLLLFTTTQSRGIEPATISVDRNWSIPESTKIGTIVQTVHVQGENNQTVSYSLELVDPFSPNQENPFWIHPHTGYVYLNKSLEGRANQRPFILSVGADDGSYSVKNQVRVSITGINGNNRNDNFVPLKNSFPKLPDFESLPTPVHGGNGGIFISSIKPNISHPINNNEVGSPQNKTYIEEDDDSDDSFIKSGLNVTTETGQTAGPSDSVQLITTPAIIPIFVAIILIFLIAGIIGVIIFRKKICQPFRRTFKKSKVDKAKNSNQSIQVITLSDESSRNSMVLQHWMGPQAYNNRYTPWSNLAARNVLITEDYTCKIADFGFARDIETSRVYERKTGGRQPIRTPAPNPKPTPRGPNCRP